MYDFYEIDDRNMRGTLRDWRQALRTPTSYRVGNAVRIQPYFVYYLIILLGGLILMLSYYNWWTSNQSLTKHRWINHDKPYNYTYPLTAPFQEGDIITFRIGVIADLDTNSRSNTKRNTYISYYKKGFLSYNRVKKYTTVTWDRQAVTLTSHYSYKGRGMELSELIVFDGRLLTFDDRSGVVFELLNNNKLIPWVMLAHGNGQEDYGFKTEWATVKDEILYVGSIGKEWTTDSGKYENDHPMWVKAVNKDGQIQHLSWVKQYKQLRGSIGIAWPGYMIHEAAGWSHIKKKWFFLPRKCSHESYNDTRDEVMGCNYLITADADFQIISAQQKKRDPKQGFSSFKFIPGTNDEAIVALKTVEFEGKTSTYITAFTTTGRVLMEDSEIDKVKYEGIEFI